MRSSPIAAAALVLLLASPARAQSAADRAQAEALFQEGLTLFDAQKFEEACVRFEQSQKKDPKLSTLFNLATCHEKIGRTASAWQEFNEAAGAAEKRGDAERASAAREAKARLDGTLSKVRILRQGEPAQVSILVDGEPFDPALLGIELPYDKGEHRYEVSAEGYETLRAPFRVQVGPSTTTITIPPLAKASAATPPPPTKPPSEAPPAAQGVSPLAIAGFTSGGALLLVGAITGGVSLSMADDLASRCPNDVCGPPEHDDLVRATALANTANVTLPLGGVGVVLGIVGLVIAPPDDNANPKIEAFGVGDVGLGLRFSL